MQLEINKKKYKFIFGVKFVREIDKKFGIEQSGVKLGLGLSTKLPELFSGNVATLSEFLYAAGQTESPSPGQDELDNYIDSVDDIEALFDGVIKEIEESNAGKLAMRTLKANLQERMEIPKES